MKRVSIMIVDDHTLIRETWSYLLAKNENFDVVAECGNGQRAIELARDKRPDVILLDINMAPMSGFDVLKMIRKFSPTSRIIGVSMHSQPAYAKNAPSRRKGIRHQEFIPDRNDGGDRGGQQQPGFCLPGSEEYPVRANAQWRSG